MCFDLRLTILLSFFAVFSAANAQTTVDEWLDALDESLSHKSEYEELKRSRIARLEEILHQTSDAEILYSTSRELFEEYKSYRNDSATVMADRMLRLAYQLGDADRLAESKCAMAFALISAGIAIESLKILDSIDPNTLSYPVRINYYRMYSKFWREEADNLHHTSYYDDYIDKSNAYLDTLLTMTRKNSPQWYNYRGSKLMREHKYNEALSNLTHFIEDKSVPAHEQAMALAEMAWAYTYMGDKDKAMICFIRSAINDNISSTREITALYLTAKLLSERGDNTRAIKYVHLALQDITFYNTRQRMLELGEILPEIEQVRYESMSTQRRGFYMTSIMFVVLMLMALYVLYMVRKKNRQLTEKQEIINGQIEDISIHNVQLEEANKIKNEYIGRTFCRNAEFIMRQEKLCRVIERQLLSKQYDKIKEGISAHLSDDEREMMYANFDTTFLNIFPDFPEKFNLLFNEADRKYPDDDKSLTVEMRIFALIRLGITDSERISNFLNYSVHTINTYKTRIKNRSVVENEKFEEEVMKI